MINQQTSTASARADELFISDFWRLFKAQWMLVIGITVAGAAAAAVIAFCMTPIFKAETALVLASDGDGKGGLGALAGQFGGLASLAGLGTASGDNKAEFVATLKSRALAARYIADNQLMPMLFKKQWNAAREDWKAEIDKKPTLWKGTELFIKDIRAVSEDKKTGLVTVSIEWSNAAQAAAWANGLVKLANTVLRERAIAKSESNLAYLNDQLAKTGVIELRQAVFRLIEVEVKNVMVAQGSSEYAFKVVDPAVAPERKIKPKPSLMILGGSFLGFVLAALIALGRRPSAASEFES